MFCTVCAAFNDHRSSSCSKCGADHSATTRAASKAGAGHAKTIAGLLPIVALLAVLLTVVGREWRQDRARADGYRAADTLLAEGRLLDARAAFADLDGYRDAGDRAAALDAAIAPLEARTRVAGDLVAGGRSAAAIVELRDIVAELPDLREAVQLLEQARRDLVADSVAESDRLTSAGDVAGARNTLVDALALEPASPTLRSRLEALDARHPLLLLTNAGDVSVTAFDGDDASVIAAGLDASWAVWSPDRTRAAFLSDRGDDEDWDVDLWTVDADGGGRRLLAGNAFGLGLPSWSPDGRSVVYISSDDFDRNLGQGWVGLRLIDLATGAQRDLTGSRFNFTTSVVWSPDGRQIAFVERHIYRVENSNQLDVRGGDVFMLDLGTGESRNLTRGRIREAWTVSWSPRGDRMMITTNTEQWASADPNQLFRLDVATGAIDEIETGGIVTSYPYWSPNGSMFAVVQDDRVVRIWSDEGESWVRLPTNVDSILSWSPDGSAILAPPKNNQDVTHLIHVGDELGRIDTIRVMFDNSYSSGGPPQWGPRTRPVADEATPSGTALD